MALVLGVMTRASKSDSDSEKGTDGAAAHAGEPCRTGAGDDLEAAGGVLEPRDDVAAAVADEEVPPVRAAADVAWRLRGEGGLQRRAGAERAGLPAADDRADEAGGRVDAPHAVVALVLSARWLLSRKLRPKFQQRSFGVRR